MGLDEAAIRARKPDIIYASLSAYGPGGPDYTKPGYDAVLQARTGIMSVTGTGEGHPMRTGVSILDVTTGTWMALGILAALLERQRSGKGQRVDASLFQTGILFMAYHLVYRQFAGVDPQPQGARHKAFAPYGSLPTAERKNHDRNFERRSVSPPVRGARPRGMGQPIRDFAPIRIAWPTLTSWRISSGQCCARNRRRTGWRSSIGATSRTTRSKAPGRCWKIRRPPRSTCSPKSNLTGEQPIVLPRLPIGLSLTPPAPQGPPPGIGQHGRSILHEAGYSDAEIDALVKSGVVGERA